MAAALYPRQMTDWGRGDYERTAKELEPIAGIVVDSARVQPGERVLDVACGTGNAALAAAARGATVTGVDSAPRLVEVAAARADRAGVRGEWVRGDAADLPFEDDAFDVAVSVFGVIFAAPAEQAVAELARVVRPGGRIAVTSWIPAGPIFTIGRILGEAVQAVQRPKELPERTAWGDPEVVRRLFGAHGASVEIREHTMEMRAGSPEELADGFFDHHPAWLSVRELLGDGAYALARRRSVQVLADLNEAGGEGGAAPGGEGFHGRSRYLVSVATLPA
jgi:SAM-dependent methyltransferase